MPADPGPIVFSSGSGHVVLQSGNPLPYPGDAGRVLLPLARKAIGAELGFGLERSADDVPWLRQQGACFITITHGAKLRGCIGTLRPHRTLAEDVQANAVAAAFRDPRFAPLTVGEYATITLEVSVLSPLQPLSFRDEQDALAQLRSGMDGVVFEYGHHTSTFLPQVWEDHREPSDFMAHLKYKAGLPPDFWDGAVRLSRYTVHKWREEP